MAALSLCMLATTGAYKFHLQFLIQGQTLAEPVITATTETQALDLMDLAEDLEFDAGMVVGIQHAVTNGIEADVIGGIDTINNYAEAKLAPNATVPGIVTVVLLPDAAPRFSEVPGVVALDSDEEEVEVDDDDDDDDGDGDDTDTDNYADTGPCSEDDDDMESDDAYDERVSEVDDDHALLAGQKRERYSASPTSGTYTKKPRLGSQKSRTMIVKLKENKAKKAPPAAAPLDPNAQMMAAMMALMAKNPAFAGMLGSFPIPAPPTVHQPGTPFPVRKQKKKKKTPSPTAPSGKGKFKPPTKAAIGRKYIGHKIVNGHKVSATAGNVVLEFRLAPDALMSDFVAAMYKCFTEQHGRPPVALKITTSSGMVLGNNPNAPAPTTGGNTKYFYEETSGPTSNAGGSSTLPHADTPSATPSATSTDKSTALDEMFQSLQKKLKSVNKMQAELKAAAARRALSDGCLTPASTFHPVTGAPYCGPGAVYATTFGAPVTSGLLATPAPIPSAPSPQSPPPLAPAAPAPAEPVAPVAPVEPVEPAAQTPHAASTPPNPEVCQVCLKAPADMYSVYCRHKAICETCAEKYSQRPRRDSESKWLKCPQCKQPIHGFMKGTTPPGPGQQ